MPGAHHNVSAFKDNAGKAERKVDEPPTASNTTQAAQSRLQLFQNPTYRAPMAKLTKSPIAQGVDLLGVMDETQWEEWVFELVGTALTYTDPDKPQKVTPFALTLNEFIGAQNRH